MKILFLAPQPFFQDRGTPIAVRLALEVLRKRSDAITVLTYHEGSDIPLPGVDIRRISTWGLIKDIGPGISLKKLLCDVFFFYELLRLLIANRKNQFAIIHAVEESVFMALVCKWFFSIPYIYDMDSSMALQVSEKWRWAKRIQPLLNWCEALSIRQSLAVVPVCDALEEIAHRCGAQDTQLLRDISLLDMHAIDSTAISDIRQEAKIPNDAIAAVYIGNLESYQGIDLLLEAFATVHSAAPAGHVIVIGGSTQHIELYRKKAVTLGIDGQVHFLGPKPVQHLKGYLAQADILLSPRSLGNNTPMKIYSYLHSGVPTLATRLPTHTQVLDDSTAMLAEPTAASFGAALHTLFTDSLKRQQLGQAAREAAERKYTFSVFERDLNSLYDRLSQRTDILSSPA